MQIKRLEIKNCLGIKELELEPGQVNLIKGANESGKTSILEVVEKALRNTQRRVRFVHDGAEEGTLFVELDNGLAVERRIKADGRTSVNLTRDGAKLSRPEAALKALAGAFNFNPVDFINLKEKEQTEVILSLVPMGLTTEQLQEWFGEVPPVSLEGHAIEVLGQLAEKHFYDRRTIANNEVKQCGDAIRALFEQLPDNYNGEAWREVNIGALWQGVQQARRRNENREKAAAIVEGYRDDEKNIRARFALAAREEEQACEDRIGSYHGEMDGKKQNIVNEMEQIKEQIRRLQEQLAGKEGELQALQLDEKMGKEALQRESRLRLEAISAAGEEELAKLAHRQEQAAAYLEQHPGVEVESLEERARQAEEQKGFVPLFDNMRRLEGELAEKQKEAERLDHCVRLARRLPAELLQQAQLPVAGLGIDENMQLTIDGLPVSNLSTSRQIRLALEIARATAGELKLICIDRFESLDPINREAFLEEIRDDGYQYFISTTELERDEEGCYRPELSVESLGAATTVAAVVCENIGGGTHASR